MDVKKTLKRYKRLQIDLNERLEEVKLKEQALNTSISSNFIESVGLTEDDHKSLNRRQREMKRARLRATEVLQDILLLKLSFVNDVIDKLQLLLHENPLQVTPFRLQFSRFYDWAETSQQLYNLNAQLYDIEKSKWSIQEPRHQQPACSMSTLTDHSLIGTHPNITDALSRLDSATSPVNSYVSERLQPRNQRMTFEASKIEEYIAECSMYQGGTLQLPPVDSSGVVRGAHPHSYHGFIEVLCNYIVERHKSSQGEDLPYAAIYTAIEHNVMPRIKHFVLKYISKVEDDAIIHEQCVKFSDITLGQLRVPLALRSHELIPFADSIAHLRATFFSQSPTDKMYSVVAAAKALHEQLSMMDEGSIDGDTFLDFWVYVTIKANVRDMATNVQFMSEYGNPQLSIAEAGYYLTTLSAAISYIKTLSAEKLQKQEEMSVSINSQFLLCEIDALNWSVSQCGIFMEVVSQKELVGYAPAAVKKWVLDKSRPYSTVLVNTGDSNDKVQVTVVRFSSKTSKHIEYFYDILTNFDVHGICCRSLEDSYVAIADLKICGDELIVLKSRNIWEQLETLRYSFQLIRLGSQNLEDEEEYPPSCSSVPVSAAAKSVSYLHLTSAQHDRSGEGSRDSSISSNSQDCNRMSNERTKGFVFTAEVYGLEVDSETDCGKKKMLKSHCMGKSDESSTCTFTSCDIAYLERNYRENHMYGNEGHVVKESSLELAKQCQMMLQKLNFLSCIHCLDGQYDNDTMNAVQSFQIAHNQQDDFSSIQLPENGYLSIATLQYLRQELLTVFANLMRLRKDVGLDVLTSFDPMSIDPDDMKKFFNFVVSFQKKVKIPQTGTLCTETIFHIKRLLQFQQNVVKGQAIFSY